MPSAQKAEEINEPLRTSAGEDLHLLLREIHVSNIRDLNTLQGRGTVLFAEGEPARGIYILRTGRAAVSISSSEGRVVILRIAQAGDVLGLNCTLRNATYDTTVKTLEACRADFIPRAQLMAVMENNNGAVAIMKLLSRELAELTSQTSSRLLPQITSGRLARVLLQCSDEPTSSNSRTRIVDKVLTHEQLAQMIGSSRETVTRLLANLRRRQIIRTTADSIVISDVAGLEETART